MRFGVKINFELVYKTVNAGLPSLQNLPNLEFCYVNTAKEKARKEHQKYLDFLKTLVKKGMEVEVSQYSCMAKGIPNHVYSFYPNTPEGCGKRLCIFCGIDDMDDL